MPEFAPGRYQDASPTVRGFKYQIQLTIMRWLDLSDEEFLYLECGEDIDRVLSANDPSGVQRELEQVKIRNTSVTLKSVEALTSLANFALHLRANPKAMLAFRFTTTANTGREKFSPFAKGEHAIKVWQDLQRKNTWELEDHARCKTLAELIKSSTRPPKVSVDAWDALMKIVQDDSEVNFAVFVSKFEWSCGSVSPEELDEILVERIKTLLGGTDSDDPVYKQRYWQLYVEVDALMAKPGEKCLTNALLKTAFSKPTLTDFDRNRIALLEVSSEFQDKKLKVMQASIEQLVAAEAAPLFFGGSTAGLKSINFDSAILGVPPLVDKLAPRKKIASELAQKIDHKKWLSINGDYGTGKSHLCFLVAEQCGGVALGISLRGLSSGSAERGLQMLLQDPAWLEQINPAVPGIVLIDDVPDCKPQGRLEILLVQFVKLILGRGRSVVSSTRQQRLSSLERIFGTSLISERTPAFTNDEAEELFRVYGVKDELLSARRISAMNVACSGHPILLTALARYVVQNDKEPEQALVDALMKGSHRSEIDLDISRSVLESVESINCRELLYRFALSSISMSLDEIRRLAAVAPVLPEPTGCISYLDGLWLRKVTDTRYEVSPLASPLSSELLSDVAKATHKEVALIILKRSRINTTEFQKAIISFLAAGEINSAAMFLIMGCSRWPNKSSGYSELGVMLFFPLGSDSKLSPVTELPIRAIQALTAASEGTDFDSYIDRIYEASTIETEEVAIGTMTAGALIMTSSLDIPSRLAIFGATLIEKCLTGNLSKFETEFETSGHEAGSHIWILTACIKTWDGIDELLGFISSLSKKRWSELYTSTELKEGLRLVIFRSLFDKNLDPTPGAYNRLEAIETRAIAIGLFEFAAHAFTGRAVILGEYERDIERVLAEAEKARDRYRSDPVATSMVKVIIGKQLLLNGRSVEALKHLSVGLRNPTHIIGHERAHSLVDAITAAWDAGEDMGIYVDELSGQLQQFEYVVPEFICQLHAQVAVVRWSQGRHIDSLKHLEISVVNFFELQDDVRARQLGVGLGHTLGYCSSILSTGKPPAEASDGSAYVEPAPRMFSGTNTGMADLWRSQQGPAMLGWMLHNIAESLGIDETSGAWAIRSQQAALKSKSAPLLLVQGHQAVSYFLKSKQWAEAIETAIVFGRAELFLDESRSKGIDPLDDSARFEPFDIPENRVGREKAEEYTINLLSIKLGSELCIYVDKNDMHDSLSELANLIEQACSDMELSESWKLLIEAINCFIMPNVTPQQHQNALKRTDGTASGDARFLAHSLLSLREDANLSQAAVSQLGSLYRFDKISTKMNIDVDLYSTEVCRFWEEAVERAAFRFKMPTHLKSAMSSYRHHTVSLRAILYLKAVSESLATANDPLVQNWAADMCQTNS